MVEITRIGSEFQVTATVKDILDVEIYRELRKEIVQAFKEKILAERAQEVMAQVDAKALLNAALLELIKDLKK